MLLEGEPLLLIATSKKKKFVDFFLSGYFLGLTGISEGSYFEFDELKGSHAPFFYRWRDGVLVRLGLPLPSACRDGALTKLGLSLL